MIWNGNLCQAADDLLLLVALLQICKWLQKFHVSSIPFRDVPGRTNSSETCSVHGFPVSPLSLQCWEPLRAAHSHQSNTDDPSILLFPTQCHREEMWLHQHREAEMEQLVATQTGLNWPSNSIIWQWSHSGTVLLALPFPRPVLPSIGNSSI